jgi:MOSC domain-containing protein YiiM
MSMLHAEGSDAALRVAEVPPETAELAGLRARQAARPVHGRVVSLNRSPGGVPKLPVMSVRVTHEGVDGDRQEDKRHHGGAERALSLYSRERIDALRMEGHPIFAGSTGENVTIGGLDWSAIVPGTVLTLGEVEAEVTSYAAPCTGIAGSFSDGRMVRISQLVHPGWSRVYARVTREGSLRVGDGVWVGVAPAYSSTS